jgi:hypothetical protein
MEDAASGRRGRAKPDASVQQQPKKKARKAPKKKGTSKNKADTAEKALVLTTDLASHGQAPRSEEIMKIEKILSQRTMSLAKWKELCR